MLEFANIQQCRYWSQLFLCIKQKQNGQPFEEICFEFL